MSCGIDKETNGCPLIEKRLFLVRPNKMLANGMERTLGRVNHYQTEYVIFISMSIILVWIISSIYLPITYQLFMSCFIISPSHKIRNKLSKRTNRFIGRYYLSLPTRSGTNHQNLLIAVSLIFILYTPIISSLGNHW